MRKLLLGACLIAGASAFAAAPVSESKGEVRGQGRVPIPRVVEALPDERIKPDERVKPDEPVLADEVRAPDERNKVSNPVAVPRGTGLAFEMQELRQQVQDLRGQLEEQNHRIERMEKDQRLRYQDVDSRLRLNTEGETIAPDVSGAESVTKARPTIEASSSNDTAEPGERAAYSNAVNLTRAKNYEGAIDAFNKELTDFPGGTYEANAFYWLGELYLALPQPQLERSRQAFAQVVNLYPENPKVPDALYKLAIVYDKLGDARKAHDYMVRVRDQHPGSTAAELATTYLSHDR